MRVTLGGAEVDLLHADEVDRRILAALNGETERPLFVGSANLDHLHHFGLDSGREGSFDPGRCGADWLVLLDGMPLVWTARRLTGVQWEQLAGSDLLPDVLRTAARARARVGFLGGTHTQHQLLATALADRFATVEVAGFWGPEREVVDDVEASAALATEIGAAEVDLLVVGLGKPRQEEWLLRHGTATGARVAVAFGAATDFLAGTVTRAPFRLRALGLEWLYRLLKEPGRLARRYLVQSPSSLVRLLSQSRTDELAAAGRQARPAPVIATPGLWRRRIARALAAADVGVIALASLIAYWLRNALGETGVVQGFENELPAALGVIPLWLLIFHYAGAYRPEVLNTGGDAFLRFVAGAFGGLLGLGFVSFLLNLSLARLYVGFLFTFVLVLGGLVRIGVRRYLRTRRGRGRLQQNVLVVGADEDAVTTARAIASDEIGGYRPVGYLTDGLPVGTSVAGGLEVLGRPADVLDVAYDVRAGLVLVSPTGVQPGTLQDVTLALEGSPVDLAVAPSLFQVVSRRVTVESVANVAILHVDQIRLERGKAALKRALDLVVASVAFVATLPLLLAAIVAIRLDSDGSVLFRQTRVGRDGREFTVFKLRTMIADAHAQRDALAHLNEADGPLFKIRDDPRITRVGRFLRTWSIDELPQLVNVLLGDMSMVGPRPPLPEEVEKYTPWQMRRLRIRPGITGVWQVSGRSDVPFDEAVRMDLFYIENWSVGTDLFLIGKTLLAIVGGRGAY